MDSPEPRFSIPAAEAESLAARSGLSVPRWLPTLVPSAKTLARPPISRFHVGAVGLGPSGRVFIGVNLEFPGLPLHQSVHAEQFLLTNMSIHSEPDLTHLAVSAAPCGHCRQFLQELRRSSDVFLIVVPDPGEAVAAVAENGNSGSGTAYGYDPLPTFLPHRFSPHDLLSTNVPLLLEPHDNGLSLVAEPLAPNSPKGDDLLDDRLFQAALEAANASHAPYSNCPSGAALMDRNGRIYKGSYAESAAFNPSMGPMQAAIVAYVAGGGGEYEWIVRGVLVEMEGGVVVRQEDTAKLFAKMVLPKCEFRVVHCRSGSGHRHCKENGVRN